MSWVILLVAGIFEVLWATGLKHSEGFSRLLPSMFTVITLIMSFVLLSIALKELPVSVAYPVWTGIGAVGTVMSGVIILNEPFDFYRLLCITLILSGITGLRLLS
ncbi:MAG TPA: multidrug efflux SMR transporter [Candidatus Rifleibacterium sp.]|nr:multidrug efflux SMR transporter [Candidatus Rifleibacterium sp.]HPT47243.1 multidrug efflux SMR transporter [Candidatus Rifleibacterium sp.]